MYKILSSAWLIPDVPPLSNVSTPPCVVVPVKWSGLLINMVPTPTVPKLSLAKTSISLSVLFKATETASSTAPSNGVAGFTVTVTVAVEASPLASVIV